MVKKAIRFCKSLHASHEAMLGRIQNDLHGKFVCYVLITCSAPSADGNMEVEMSFEGDPDLAGLLTESATQVFDAQQIQQESQ